MKKTGVLFTISSVNFELKQGNNIEQNIFSEFSAWVWARVSLSSPLQSCCCSHLNSSVLVFNSKLVIIVFPFFINLI